MGLTVLDAGVVIALLDANDPHHAGARDALTASVERGDALALSASAYAEALVAPSRQGAAAIRALDGFLADLAVEVEPITRQIAKKAAGLRARHGKRVRLPDALVIAAALHLRADRILTTDRGWPRLAVRVDII